MSITFELQLLASVIVGGIFVAIQTLIAERVPQSISGILLSIPSTLVVALFFIGLTLSVQDVSSIVPVIPLSFGIGLIFVCVYTYTANILKIGRAVQLIVSTIVATLVWILLAFPLAYIQFTSISLSLFLYFCLLIISHYFLAVRPNVNTVPLVYKYTTVQKLIRSMTGGLIIGIIILLANTLGSIWGGIVSGFPAVFLSALLIVHWQHGAEFLFHITKALPLGSPIFPLYAIIVQYSYPHFGIELGTLIALILSLIYPFLIMVSRQKTRAQCSKNQDRHSKYSR